MQINISMETMQTSIWSTRSISGERRGSGKEDLQKCDYLIQGRAVNCKITPSPMPLGCWSGGLGWSLHNFHGEVGLHLIYSHFIILAWVAMLFSLILVVYLCLMCCNLCWCSIVSVCIVFIILIYQWVFPIIMHGWISDISISAVKFCRQMISRIYYTCIALIMLS